VVSGLDRVSGVGFLNVLVFWAGLDFLAGLVRAGLCFSGLGLASGIAGLCFWAGLGIYQLVPVSGTRLLVGLCCVGLVWSVLGWLMWAGCAGLRWTGLVCAGVGWAVLSIIFLWFGGVNITIFPNGLVWGCLRSRYNVLIS
jgi:hypothetical protein